MQGRGWTAGTVAGLGPFVALLGEDTGVLFETADAALYRAKGLGRNRVQAVNLDQPAAPAVALER